MNRHDRGRVLSSRDRFFTVAGIQVGAVMIDDGACYRSRAHAAALGDSKYHFNRPYRPETTGKVERFHRLLAAM